MQSAVEKERGESTAQTQTQEVQKASVIASRTLGGEDSDSAARAAATGGAFFPRPFAAARPHDKVTKRLRTPS